MRSASSRVARSILLRHSIGLMPPRWARSAHRSTSPGRNGGSAAEVTITACSAFAATTWGSRPSPPARSREVRRGAMETMERAPSASRSTSTPSPTASTLERVLDLDLSFGPNAAGTIWLPSQTRALEPNIWARIIKLLYPIARERARLIPDQHEAYTPIEDGSRSHHLPPLRRIAPCHPGML